MLPSGLVNLVQYNPNAQNNSAIQYYPEITINCDNVSQSAGNTTLHDARSPWTNIIIPVNEGTVKRVVRTLYEYGFRQALSEARSPQTAESCPLLASGANILHNFLKNLELLQSKIFPFKNDIDLNNLVIYAETRDWERSYVRYIAWHPNCFKIAVAGLDDFVRVYTEDANMISLFKFPKQKRITSMAWRPCSDTELAVSCENGIILWNALRTTLQPELSKHPEGKPIVSVQWNPDGSLLASSSIGDTNIIIWNLDSGQLTVLTRTGPPCSLLKWSPNGSYLFSATLGKTFRVWNTSERWTPERWTTSNGFIQSACWSPCSEYLLFVNSHDHLLYYLQFGKKHFATRELSSPAIAVTDLSKIAINKQEIGGKPQQLAWDPSGLFLAVSFKNSSSIVLFTTSKQIDDFIISPHCYIFGQGAEYPGFICFESMHQHNKDVILTVGWSSGRVQFIPCQ